MKTEYLKVLGEYAGSGIYVFTRKVELEKEETYRIRIFTTGRYMLYINGTYVCDGPCKGHEYVRYYDETQTCLLKKGENEISVRVLHMGRGEFCTVYPHPYPMMLFEAVSDSCRIASDEQWECRKDGRYRFFYMDDQVSLPPGEEVTYGVPDETCQIEVAGGYRYENGFDFEKGAETFGGVVRSFWHEKRPIPMIVPGEPESLKVIKKGDGFLELDAGRYVTARVMFEIAADSDVKILYSECYETQEGKKVRDDNSGFLKGYYDIVHTAGKDEVYEAFWYKAFRFIRIEAKDPERAVKKVQMKICHYPVELEGSFVCSDENYNRMYNVSIDTMLCCMYETFMDCPHYEQQQYVMDSAIESNVLMRMTGDRRLIRKCITEFAASQQPNGLLRCNYPNTLVQIIPGFSFFWIFMLRDYLNYAKETEFVQQQLGCMDKVLGYFAGQVREKGYISDSVYWDYVDWVPAWEMGVPGLVAGAPHTIYNLYYAYALLCAEEICRKLGKNGHARDYREEYEKVCVLIRKHCYDSRMKLFRDSGEGTGFSVHTIMWAVLAGVVEGKEADEMIGRIHEEGLSRPSFSMNYYLFRALEKSGHREQIFENYAGWEKMLSLNCSTWCENPDSPRSECHGWSSAPLFDFAVNVLGVQCGFEDEIVVAPLQAGLSYARGAVPTRFGIVSVDWNAGEKFVLKVSAPEGIRKRVILPDGREEVFEGGTAEFEV